MLGGWFGGGRKQEKLAAASVLTESDLPGLSARHDPAAKVAVVNATVAASSVASPEPTTLAKTTVALDSNAALATASLSATAALPSSNRADPWTRQTKRLEHEATRPRSWGYFFWLQTIRPRAETVPLLRQAQRMSAPPLGLGTLPAVRDSCMCASCGCMGAADQLRAGRRRQLNARFMSRMVAVTCPVHI